MSAPFQPGDVVVCVDDSPRRLQKVGDPFPVRRGAVGRVSLIRQSRTGYWGLFADGYPLPDTSIGFHCDRFRKIDDEVTEEFRETLSAIKVPRVKA